MNESRQARHQDNTDWLREENLQLPTDMNDQSVANHLKMISRTNPQQLPATVQAIRERWAYGVGGWAERGRLEYVKTVLLQLQISHDILSQCLAMDDEWQTHQEKKTRRQAKTVAGIYELEAEAEAEELRTRIAKAKADQAEERKRQQDIANPPASARELTAEERRKQKSKEIEEEINRLTARRDEVLSKYMQGRRFEELSPKMQDEYRADENRYNDRIQHAKERKMQFE